MAVAGMLGLSTAPLSAVMPVHIGPDGYRVSHYRAPTPESVPRAVTLTTLDLLSLMRIRAPILVDVLAIEVRPETADFGFAWLPAQPRYNIPGSI
jgi:hypothetical protein